MCKKMNRLALVFLFVGTLCEIVVIEKQKDRIFRSHVLFEVSMPMWSLCAQFCSRVPVCKSINFIARSKTCQVNAAEPREAISELHESVGNSFVASSTFPKELAGSCQGHGCQLSEVCIPKATTYSCIPLIKQFHERRTRYPTTDDLETKQTNGNYQRSTSDVLPSSTHISTTEELPTITEKTTDAIGYPTTDDLETKQTNGNYQRSTSDVLPSSTHISTTEELPTITEKTTDAIETSTLKVNNGFSYGNWCRKEYCAQGHFAIGYSMKIEADQGIADDTALNAIRLQCGKPHWTGSKDYDSTVIGVEGQWGGWTSSQLCPNGEVMVSFSLQVEQKITRDNTAANYVRFKCRDIGSDNLGTVLGGSGMWGSYGAWSGYCTVGSVICGLQVKMEPYQGILIDDTSLNDVNFCCCKNQL